MNMHIDTPTVNRQAAVNGLAIVGFMALVAGGMWLAVYSARFVPEAVSRLGAAAVSLSQIFTPGGDAGLTVIPNATTTIPFGNATTTATSTAATSTPNTGTGSVTPTPGHQTSTTTQIGGTNTPAPSGLADLVVNITTVGYLATTSTGSFITATSVPAGARPAVKFTIKNIGTNFTGSWQFTAQIPTQTAYIYNSIPQQSLGPNDSIEYILGFDQANRGANQLISVSANSNHSFAESSFSNNSASTTITVLGN